MFGPNPKDKHPMNGFPQVCFIQNTVSNPNISIGDYTYSAILIMKNEVFETRIQRGFNNY